MTLYTIDLTEDNEPNLKNDPKNGPYVVGRYYRQVFADSSGNPCLKEGVRILQRKSKLDTMQADAILESLQDQDYKLDYNDLQSNDLVELYIVVTGYDYDSGYPDEWEVQVKKLPVSPQGNKMGGE